MKAILQEKLGGVVSVLCLIHCLGTAVVALLLPALASQLRIEWLEGVLTLAAVLLIGRSLRQQDEKQLPLPVGLFVAALLALLCGVVFGKEIGQQIGLFLLVLTQLAMLRGRREVSCACPHPDATTALGRP